MKPLFASASSRRSFLRQTAVAVAAVPAATLGLSRARAEDAAEIARDFHDIQRHENDHVGFLVDVLGDNARPSPIFQNLEQATVDDFVAVTRALENTGTGAYLGALPFLSSRDLVAAAGSIAEIEARHAGWINTFLGAQITTNVFGDEQSFERPLTVDEVVSLTAPFIADLNSDIPFTYSHDITEANDLCILNFALALEYLEAEFYNLNVLKFFGP